MTHFSDSYLFKKIAPKRQGPFEIKKVLGKLIYRLDLKGQRKIHDDFHASLLTHSIMRPNNMRKTTLNQFQR
jgi:hypothetical protein